MTAKSDIYDGSIDPCHVELLAQFQVRANLVIPIMHEDQFWGLLIAHHCSKPRVWRDLEIELLQQLTTHVSIALQQAQLYQQVQASEELKRRMLESSSDCIKLLDLDGRLLYMNAGGMCLMEIDNLDDYLQQKWSCFWSDEVQPEMEKAIALTKAGKLSRFQGYCATAKGTPKFWDVIISPVLNATGQVVQLLAVSRDISQSQQTELDLRESEERDRVLEWETAARGEAERANRIKDEFLAIVSHELRSPLNPILGWSQLLQTQNFDQSRMAQGLEIIERNAKLQSQLIDDLLDVAKILRGKLSLNTTPLNLVIVIQSALEAVKTAAVAKSISLNLVLPNIGQIAGDFTRLQQIIWNLLSNAIKFTPSGGQVDICLEQIDNLAQITVSDTGKGINSDFLPHIFEYFRQQDASITRNHGGLGLGLAIVYHLVEAHGGTISAESDGEGLGATFTVRLPLISVEPEMPPTNMSNRELDLTGIQVLCVDDQLDSRELLDVLLTQYGAKVMTVASATEALRVIESSQPDILVSDIGMPETNGYSLIEQIRSLPPARGGQIPAIALTAYAGETDRERALSCGFQEHLPKPVDANRLIQTMLTLVRNQSGVVS